MLTVKKLVLSAAIFASASVSAADTQWYLGGSLHQSNFSIDTGAVDASALAAGATTSTTTVNDDTRTSFQFFAGYRINENLALEGGYVDFGTVAITTVTTGPAATINSTADVTGWTAAALGIFPATDSLDVFVKGGVLFWESDSIARAGAVTTNATSDGNDFFFGVGADWKFTDSIAARVAYDRYNNLGNDDISVLSIGLVINF